MPINESSKRSVEYESSLVSTGGQYLTKWRLFILNLCSNLVNQSISSRYLHSFLDELFILKKLWYYEMSIVLKTSLQLNPQ